MVAIVETIHGMGPITFYHTGTVITVPTIRYGGIQVGSIVLIIFNTMPVKKEDNYFSKVLSSDENSNIFKLIGERNRVLFPTFVVKLRYLTVWGRLFKFYNFDSTILYYERIHYIKLRKTILVFVLFFIF